MAEEQDEANWKRQSLRELKYVANSFNGLLLLADALEEPADLQKEVDALKAELVALKAERANYTNLTAEIAAAKSELAVITADIARVRSMFKTA